MSRWDEIVTTITASNSTTIERPFLDPIEQETRSGGWKVTVFNNEHNTYEEVMLILMAATACTAEEAYIETWEIDHMGKSVVHFACEDECNRVAQTIAQIGIKVEATPEL